jgi:hypothetical protein
MMTEARQTPGKQLSVSVGRNKRSALRRKRSLFHAASVAYLRRLITSTAAEAAVSARRSPFAREGAMLRLLRPRPSSW